MNIAKESLGLTCFKDLKIYEDYVCATYSETCIKQNFWKKQPMGK